MKNINHSNSRYANILADIEKKAADHCKTIGRYDESLFNIGIELGKLLQSNNIQEQRLQIFTNFDKSNAEYTKKHAYVKRIENIIGCFVANAFAQQIENNGAFTFSRPNFMHKCEKLEESISSEFFMQIISTKQKENGGSFQVELDFNGQLAEIFNAYGISSSASFEVDNSTGDDQETLYRADDVKKIFYVKIDLNAKTTKLTYQQLSELANSLKEIQVFLLLSIDKVQSFKN
jgi:hypothetical protein